MLVRQAISQGSDLDEIIDILCKELPGEKEKTHFRQSVTL